MFPFLVKVSKYLALILPQYVCHTPLGCGLSYPIVLSPEDEEWHGDVLGELSHLPVSFLRLPQVLLDCVWSMQEITREYARDY